MKKILMVLTNASKIDDEHETGLWLSEFAEPYEEFTNQGFEVDVASLKGGRIPLDPNSLDDENVETWKGITKELDQTLVLSQLNVNEYHGIFLPGGHGTMFDLPDSPELKEALAHFAENNKAIGAVCHGPAGFTGTKLSNGKFLVDGISMTGFTNEEEQQTGLDSLMPFLLETKLREQGAQFEKSEAWSEHVITDGKFVTGQNPQSSQVTAEAFVKVLS
ncbi:glutamine amidotransferase [[Bacillus] enclensis]|jgi:putative intracellular protease/amidase|uniref:Putative intracellular protease/amidase n=1 Tax=[Bacillus] enclensis TaxID=1402860 RepID=A0A0V8HK18_9BACI|nr:type 1 glutamine amidotransferase domain-containing protein [[Bacillus] enclensis]KSU62794.1 glutamine amidotransferase [[Bacillus] enclensis]MBH9965154.1 type 1 glutamine amidotransferase domain-containing protein [[Bacillus] enclensis]QTC42686.1 type 1 glutamine amidotransferase domain-containing protein [Bacillus sp. V3]SCC09683.1 Putative intracellular protease/amidase [[Bacillus] enclensis]